MKPRLAAVSAALIVLALTGVIDGFARQSHQTDVRASVSNEAESLARNLNDVVARETSAVDALGAFVATDAAVGQPDDHIAEEFEVFAEALMTQGETIRSVQMAPGSILDFVYPVEGNEAAVGLDLMADPDRRELLEPAIETGETVIQGPVELVQGGVGLIVRTPIYEADGTFWGFAAVVLDWPSVAAFTELSSESSALVAGVRLPANGRVVVGDPTAFDGDPVLLEFQVGATDTTWELAARPAGGWPTRAPITPGLWVAGALFAFLVAWQVFAVTKRPELLQRERQRALQDLAAAEARYKATFEHAGVGIVLADDEGLVLSANPSFCRIAGVDSSEEIVGTSVTDLVHPSDRTALLAQTELLLTGVPVVENEIRINVPEGETWCRTSVSLIAGDDPGENTYVCIAEDITARRVAEASLAESERRFRQLFERAPIAIQREDYTDAVRRLDELAGQGVTDLRAYLDEHPDELPRLLGKVKIIDANPAAMQLQEHLASGADEVTLLDRFHEEAAGTFVDTLTMIFEGRLSAELVVNTRSADGSVRHLDVRWHAPLVDGRPNYANVMATISDVTELRETGRRLQALLESKDRFLASVAHELRTPLTAVVGFAEELNSADGNYTPQEQREFQQLIAFQSAELAHIVEDLLVWARSDIGEVRINPRLFDLGKDVRQSVQLSPDGGIPVHEPDGPVDAVADPIRVRQIVRNLVTNAHRYGGDNASVTVKRAGDHAVLEVSDDGPAIPPERAARIFEPYERSGGGLAQPGSIGLGLSVSRSLARLHGGDVVFVREGDRNVFRVTLPIGTAGSDETAPTDSSGQVADAPQAIRPAEDATPSGEPAPLSR